ncbi:MAG TPA: superoxide dismutase [Chloroflexota bacterium]
MAKAATLVAHELPPLPYEYDALEPHCDRETLELHHDKHHRAYVDKLNHAVEKHADLASKDLEDLLRDPEAIPPKIRSAVMNNAGGHFNHSFFWHCMGPDQDHGHRATGSVGRAIDETFGSFDEFRDKFKEMALGLFGSGWTFLVMDAAQKLEIRNYPNQDCPLSDGLIPLLALDLWEHAYYLKFHNRRDEWSDTWWNVVNWDEVNSRYLMGG